MKSSFKSNREWNIALPRLSVAFSRNAPHTRWGVHHVYMGHTTTSELGDGVVASTGMATATEQSKEIINIPNYMIFLWSHNSYKCYWNLFYFHIFFFPSIVLLLSQTGIRQSCVCVCLFWFRRYCVFLVVIMKWKKNIFHRWSPLNLCWKCFHSHRRHQFSTFYYSFPGGKEAFVLKLRFPRLFFIKSSDGVSFVGLALSKISMSWFNWLLNPCTGVSFFTLRNG